MPECPNCGAHETPGDPCRCPPENEEQAAEIDRLNDVIDELEEEVERLEAQVPRWIPVAERLPDTRYRGSVPYGSILLFGISGKDEHRWVEKQKSEYPFGPKRFIGGYTDKHGFVDDGYPCPKVTHWMDLNPEPAVVPSPPTSEE